MPKKTAPRDTSIDKALEVVSGDVDVPLAKDRPFSFPEYGYFTEAEKKPCAWAFKKPFSPRVELEIVTDKKSKKLGVPSGPAIRLCFKKDTPAPLIPVKTVGKAVEIGDRYLKCLKTQEGAEQCALNSAKDYPHKIAGAPRRRSRRR